MAIESNAKRMADFGAMYGGVNNWRQPYRMQPFNNAGFNVPRVLTTFTLADGTVVTYWKPVQHKRGSLRRGGLT